MHKLNARFVLIQPTSVCPLCQRYPTMRNYKGFRHEEPTPEEMTDRALFITQHCCPLCSVQWENVFYYEPGKFKGIDHCDYQYTRLLNSGRLYSSN
jgi:hypothetical protein